VKIAGIFHRNFKIRLYTDDISRFDGIIQLDPLDTALRDAISILAIKNEEPLPGVVDNKLGLCDIVTEVFYIIQ